jgi:hypothetical protein
MRGSIPPLPNTPLLLGAQLKRKHSDTFTLQYTQAYTGDMPRLPVPVRQLFHVHTSGLKQKRIKSLWDRFC